MVRHSLYQRSARTWPLDLDPDRSAARRIVEFVARIAPSAGR